MKLKVIFSALALVTFFFFSCQRNEGQQAPVTAVQGEIEAAADQDNQRNHGFILRDPAVWFLTIANDTGSESDVARSVMELALGESVTVGELRRATWEGTIHNFREIRRGDGTEGLAWATQVVEGGALAVVIDENANMFSSARIIDAIGTTIPRGRLVVYFPETEHDGFVEIRTFQPRPAPHSIITTFVRTSSISTRVSDVQSSILLHTARPLGTEGTAGARRTILLEEAIRSFPDSVFVADIQELLTPAVLPLPLTEPVELRYMYVSVDNNVNVRVRPDLAAGNIIGSVSRADLLIASERTVDDFVIDGYIARWYRITHPLEGWIFGAFIEIAAN